MRGETVNAPGGADRRGGAGGVLGARALQPGLRSPPAPPSAGLCASQSTARFVLCRPPASGRFSACFAGKPEAGHRRPDPLQGCG